MRAIKEARKLMEKSPDSSGAKILSRLVLALESEGNFQITELYQLDYNDFKLAMEILQEWRIDRHYASKSKLFETSRQLAAGADTQQPAAKADKDSSGSAKK